MKLDLPDIMQVLEKKKYGFSKDYKKLNIVGIRSADMTPNIFNDFLFVFWAELENKFNFNVYNITTDPGLYYLYNPSNIDGTAILCPGRYNAYKLDIHNHKYLALCQRRAPVRVWRDFNRNNRYDSGKIYSGYFGINIHRAGSESSLHVDKWSAGCQVFQTRKDFDEFIKLCFVHRDRYENEFVYNLITEADLIEPALEKVENQIGLKLQHPDGSGLVKDGL